MFKKILKTALVVLLTSTLAHAAAEKTTVENLLTKGDTLNQQEVQVDGKVVKVSKAIMKTDWVHVEDEKGNKVIFRSVSHNVNIGDKVTATGTVNANVDYGYGYAYKVIVVDSTFKKN